MPVFPVKLMLLIIRMAHYSALKGKLASKPMFSIYNVMDYGLVSENSAINSHILDSELHAVK